MVKAVCLSIYTLGEKFWIRIIRCLPQIAATHYSGSHHVLFAFNKICLLIMSVDLMHIIELYSFS